jgi:hypothetical protein
MPNIGDEKESGNLETLINSAIGVGISSIIQTHPRLHGQENNLLKYIDQKTIQTYTKRFAKKYQQLDEREKPLLAEEFYNTLAGYVASGKLFDNSGKNIVLRNSWKRKAWIPWFGRKAAKEVLQGEEYLDEVTEKFKNLYQIMSSEEYAKSMPELANALKTIYNAGFWDTTINILYESNKINKRKYLTLKRALKEKVEAQEKVAEPYLKEEFQIDQYLKTTAVVFGGIGIIVILATALSSTITGNIIGITDSSTLPPLIFGICSLIAGIFLGLKIKK